MYQVELELLPDPYIGRLDAPVMLLALNPGFNPVDLETHKNIAFQKLCLDNLHQRQQNYPFYYLNPTLSSGGRIYWERKLKQPIKTFGQQFIAQNVVCVQYFPYHSCAYGRGIGQIPSQQYTFEIVREAIRRRALIVVMRSWQLWTKAVVELDSYPKVIRLKNPRNPTISKGNCPDNYHWIVGALEQAARTTA